MPITINTPRDYAPAPPSAASGGFTPSHYQLTIFDFVERQGGNALVGAVAGSGKTTTIIELVKRLPVHVRQRTLILAYNKHIQEELRRRAPQGVTVLTNHALGMRALSRFFSPRDRENWVDKYKYRDLVRVYWERHLMTAIVTEAQEVCADLIRYAMVTLSPTDPESLLLLADRYGVDIPPADEETILQAVPTVLRWGREGLETPTAAEGLTYHPSERISFDDMIYLPHVVPGVRLDQYALVLVDEAQDLSAAQLATALGAMQPNGGRILAVGDKEQAIYAFSGADARSFEEIAERTNATRLPLSVCYRCPRRVIALVRERGLHPHIEAAPNAPEGVVQDIGEESALGMARPGDMLLCRTHAPLIAACFRLIQRGVGATVLGRDIGLSITRALDAVEKMPNFRFEEFPAFAETYRAQQLAALAQRKNSEQQIMNLNDRVDCLLEIHSGGVSRGVSSVGGLRSEINRLFSENGGGRGLVTLSSIHKAKGLEADRVFLLLPHLLPHPMARSAEAVEQEFHLAYVAATRAKRELYLAHDASGRYPDDCPFPLPDPKGGR